MQNAGVPSSRGPVRRWVFAVVLVSFAFLTLGSWAVSSPVSSSPDDDFHLASIWCADGQWSDGTCAKVGAVKGGAVPVMVPAAIAGRPCYAFSPDSAACTRRVGTGLSESRANAGLYPAAYYAALHPFVSSNITHSVITMRLVNAAIALMFVGAAVGLTSGALRRGVVLSWMVCLMPLGLFIIPSTNPSSWAITGLGTMWAFLLRFLIGERGWQQIASGVMVAASFALACMARADSPVFGALIAVACSFVAIVDHRRLAMRRLAAPAAVVVVGGILALFGGAASTASKGVVSDGVPAREVTGHLGLLIHNLVRSPELILGAFGMPWGNSTASGWGDYWGLGWLDTPMPPEVPAIVVGGLALLLGVALRNVAPVRLLAVLPLLVGIVAVPVWLLEAAGLVVGQNIQARYLLPMVLATVGLCLSGALLRRGEQVWVGTWRQYIVLAVAIAVANFYALQANIVRYVSGLPWAPLDPNSAIHWWWANPLTSPRTVLLFGTLAGLIAMIAAARMAWRSQDGLYPRDAA